VRPGTFSEDIPGYTLYAERVDGSRWENVLIHDRSSPSTPVLALASHGRLEPVGAGQEMRLRLDRGEIHREDADSQDYLVAGFEHGSLSIGLGTALTDRTNIGRTSNELTLSELRERATPGPGKKPEDARRARSFLHRRIASPLAVLPFALLAVPIAASRRAGRAFGVGATIFAVLAHYLLLRSGEVLAQRGALPAVLSLQIPNLVLSAVALVLIAAMARRGPGAVR
jgi:lipopolysaccharide export system permease protein